jgi:hypothetical protein
MVLVEETFEVTLALNTVGVAYAALDPCGETGSIKEGSVSVQRRVEARDRGLDQVSRLTSCASSGSMRGFPAVLRLVLGTVD